ncbi:MAG: hypothetical protein FH748_16890 [Balneolaceae bacterium]|nr:hypothetical protein [Balneolaceae bacterium]
MPSFQGIEESSQCPSEMPRAKKALEDFLSRPVHDFDRVESGTTDLNPDEIRLLTDNNTADITVCSELKQTYDGDNMLIREVTYYQVGSFYFVVAVLVPVKDPNIVMTGPDIDSDAVVVLDQHLNKLGVYDVIF